MRSTDQLSVDDANHAAEDVLFSMLKRYINNLSGIYPILLAYVGCDYIGGFLSESCFHLYAQSIIESYYLQPLTVAANGDRLQTYQKDHLQNGRIEREIHGAMHAVRVSLYVRILHQLFQRHFPDYVKKSLSVVAAQFNLSHQQIMLLVQYTALGHDAARQGEGRDRWEDESANAIEELFKNHGVDSGIACAFGLLVLRNDKSAKLKKALLSNCSGVQRVVDRFWGLLGYASVQDGMDYLRRLITQADNFDIIRCTGKFDYTYIEKHLFKISDFNYAIHNPIFWNFAKQVYGLLKRQGDLYFRCQLNGPNSESYELPDGAADYSNRFKVQIEHADNVLLALENDLAKTPYFAQYLANCSRLKFSLYKGDPAFNPYIHGTTSLALAIMKETNFQLLSPVKLIRDFGLAPLGGELSGGGLGNASATCRPCFARLSGHNNSNEYTLASIIYNYADQRSEGTGLFLHDRLSNLPLDCWHAPPVAHTLKKLNQSLERAPEILFSNINLILLFMTRYRMLGGDLSKVPLLKNFDAQYKRVFQLFYLYLLLGSYFGVNNKALALEGDQKDKVFDAIRTHFTREKLAKKIDALKLDLSQVYHHPTKENLENCLALLELPRASMVRRGFSATLTQTELQCTQPFKVTSPYAGKCAPDLKGKYFHYTVSNIATDFHPACLLWRYASGELKQASFYGIRECLINYIADLRLHQRTFHQLLARPHNPFCPDNIQKLLIAENFPVILLYDSDHHMRIMDFQTQEYRAQKALQLGIDIRVVATDTPKNQHQLVLYFKQVRLDVKVVLFSDLQSAKERLFNGKEVSVSDHQVALFARPLPNNCVEVADVKAQGPTVRG